MNLKHLLPSFRNRFQFVISAVKEIALVNHVETTLNIGSGEGDFDAMLSRYTLNLISCDINDQDVDTARKLNKHINNLKYEIKDALHTGYKDNSFDLVVCTEVIEHVGSPKALIQEIFRIVKPGGSVVMTFPIIDFPWTYDPINYTAKAFKTKMPFVNQGAFAFGHDYLIDLHEFQNWTSEIGFVETKQKRLSRYLVGILEMYWTGWLQKGIKSNASNDTSWRHKNITYVPKNNRPSKLTLVTDAILSMDESIFSFSKTSIGLGVVLYKNELS